MKKRLMILDGHHYEIFDNLNIKFCINCSKYGHLAKNCVNEMKCYKCSSSHSYVNCNLLDIDMLCPSCGLKGHSGLSRRCNIFLSKVYLALERINFNYDRLVLEPKWDT